MSTEQATTWLVGDVGATNARFGLVSPDGAVLHSVTFACADFAEIGDALDAYLAMRGNFPMPRRGALAIAALITGDQIRMTNHPWSFSVAALRDRLGLERLVAINDFTAVALALPRLTAADRMPVGAAHRSRDGRSGCSAPVRGSAFRA
jgi:glucokinase